MATVKQKMTAIADKIRSITMDDEKMNLDEMPTQIERCHDVGYENGVVYGNGMVDEANLEIINKVRGGYGKDKTLSENVDVVTNAFGETKELIAQIVGSSDAVFPTGDVTDLPHATSIYGMVRRDEGVAIGHIQGEEHERSNFWDTFQNFGKRTNYQYMFNTGWNQDTFKPKYDMVLDSLGCNNMFGGGGSLSTNRGIDLRKSAIGITIDFSNCTSFNGAFAYAYGSSVVAIGTIDTRNATSLLNMFTATSALHTVEKLILKDDGSQTGMNMSNATALKDITIEGVIGCNISFKNSPLYYESLVSIITHLKNYSGTDKEYAYTFSFHESAFELLLAFGSPSSEGIDFDGTWVEYIDSLGWNY